MDYYNDIIINDIIDYFCSECEITYKSLDNDVKEVVLKYIPLIFKKWLYSPLGEGYFLSSADLLELGIANQRRKAVFDCDITIHYNKVGIKKYNISYLEVTRTNHPFTKDLLSFVEFCIPDAAFDNGGFLSLSDSLRLSIDLKNSSPFYINYLTLISKKLGLIEKLPSIHTLKYTAKDNYKAFFKQSGEVRLRNMLKAVLEICSEQICLELKMPRESLSYESLSTFFKEQYSVNEIIGHIYMGIGIDIENIFQDDQLANIDLDLLSSMNYVGHLIDKWYITPLCMLNLIHPIYQSRLDIKEELNYISNLVSLKSFVDVEVFSPPTLYRLTHLGGLLVKNNKKYLLRDRFRKKNELSFSISQSISELRLHQGLTAYTEKEKKILVLKISYLHNPLLWISFEFKEDATLSQVYFEIRQVFGIIEDYSYKFINSIDNKYYFDSIGNSPNNDCSVKLSNLFKHIRDELVLDISDLDSKLVISLIKINKSKKGLIYPRPVGISDEMSIRFRD